MKGCGKQYGRKMSEGDKQKRKDTSKNNFKEKRKKSWSVCDNWIRQRSSTELYWWSGVNIDDDDHDDDAVDDEQDKIIGFR